ncbi:MAG: urease accessory protein UreD [Burkholderiales bacterium]|nr:urease accessory protein UreD [Burkholderiales bacterium]
MKSLAAETPADLMPSRKHWKARLALGFADDAGTTRLVERAHHGPLLVQKPLYPEGPQICHTIVVHPPGGVVGGDELAITANVGANANAFITTPGAAKWYRANGYVAHQDIQLDIQAGASLEWLPQETIFFNAAQVQLDQSVILASDARYIGWEILCFGRTASGESFDAGKIVQRTSIRRGGKLLWYEQGDMRGASASMTSPLGLRDSTVCATLLAVGDAVPAALLQQIRECTASAAAGAGWTGATQMKQLCVVRFLGHSSEIAKQVMTQAWQLLRPAIVGRAAVTPRIWHT